MDVRRIRLSEELRAAREDLLNINFATDKTDMRGVSRPYGLTTDWVDKWIPTFKRLIGFTHASVDLDSRIRRKMGGYDQDTDVEIFNELRTDLVRYIDEALTRIDQEHEVRPLLEDYILRVKSPKLAVLLNEFNKAKDIAPNHIGIGYRTILSLIIQEIAKRVNPTSKTATRTDLAPKDVLSTARSENILSKDEDRFIKSFESTHKEIADLVTHRPDVFVDKSDLDVMVDLLNRLLPSIIN